jgi:GcrA cell cycle regulator
MTYWSDEQITLLREICLQGSCSETARAINAKTGSRFTRNSVIGKLHRLGLRGVPTKGGRQLGVPQAPRKPVGHGGGSGKRAANIKRDRSRETVPVQELPPADFLGVEFLDLQPGQCHFPRGDGPFLFCGQVAKEGSSYCPACHQRAFVKPTSPTRPRVWRNFQWRQAA